MALVDRLSLLGFHGWEFALRSLGRRYGLLFLGRVILRHPANAVRSVLRYQRIPVYPSDGGEVVGVLTGSEDQFFSRISGYGTRLVVGLGFCQKPLEPECPSGRANHDCVYLDRLDLASDTAPTGPACSLCPVREVGTLALGAGACLYLMTSAEDIALDVMIPSLEEGRFSSFIMGLCPYSVRLIRLPLFICGLEGYLLAYQSGACANWEQWLRADEGFKGEVTELGPAAREKMVSLLTILGEARREEGLEYLGFERRGNVYVPVPSEE